MQENELEQIAVELDAAHARSKEAFRAKDLDGYMSIFNSNLTYKQANGKIINWGQLRSDVAPQLASVQRMDTAYVREHLERDGPNVVELLTQTASYATKVFFYFTRKWDIHRKGRYVWSNIDTGWQITSVEIISEHVS